ncbi:small glutamine-rich tetratricopeptide repeat-containing protein beta-like [Anopheles nili]|uniref:small glutamine-rich tetratricopeptide repeat-containing protein beta-like n=1 Tax=Anopheles nili TaxID=185578 RepID=UPI00237B6009|nr:small glutamine-rich tetratricopeptide repeat-containing protein beta-like [Anopheles nili]
MSDSHSPDAKYFVRSFIRFLSKQIEQPNFNEDSRESIEVAIQCLENVYELNEAGEAAPEGETSVKKEDEKDDPRNHVDLFELYRNTFVVVSPERKQEAEITKNEGNRLMKEEKYMEAVQTYTKAINLDATNPVFYCNRAAAFSRLGDYVHAAEDCQMALRHDPNYSKAWGRLGLAYSKMNQHKQAITAYQNAIRLEPDNQDYKNNLGVSQQCLEDRSRNPPAGGNPLSNIDFAAVINNPDMVQMATRMMSDPAIHSMLGQLGGMNNMDALLETGRRLAMQMNNDNPELFSNIARELERGGVNLPRNNPGPNPDGSQPPPPPPSSS